MPFAEKGTYLGTGVRNQKLVLRHRKCEALIKCPSGNVGKGDGVWVRGQNCTKMRVIKVPPALGLAEITQDLRGNKRSEY